MGANEAGQKDAQKLPKGWPCPYSGHKVYLTVREAHLKAKADKTKAEARKLSHDLRGASLTQMNEAIQAAMAIAGAPAVGAAVDRLMQTAQADAEAANNAGQPAPDAAPQLPEPQPAAQPQPMPGDLPPAV